MARLLDPLGCTLEFRLLRRCRRDMLAASFSLHYPKLPFRMTLRTAGSGGFATSANGIADARLIIVKLTSGGSATAAPL